MNRELERIYKVAIYLRLSKDDGDLSFSANGKTESNSISNQRELIMSFISQQPDMTIVDEYKDDGRTGTNFERSEFQRMMNDIYSNRVDCVIVKDLSRFGREYIECGKYIEKVFPQLGVRFIALTDNYDSTKCSSSDAFILPFKNLMNDSYSRDISIRVRKVMNEKRQNGAFVASFAVYGYMRNPDNKNQLIIDEFPAGVVRDIFKWKIEGLSPNTIAKRLNDMGIPSPAEYKKSQGFNYYTDFKKGTVSIWGHNTVRRILRSEIYTGVMVQGKTTTPNYKTVKSRPLEENDWIRVENTHEPIISRRDFDLVQILLKEDTHATDKNGNIPIYSGRIFCADCGAPMVRKTSYCNGKRYVYYVCSANKANKDVCSHHSVRETAVSELVTKVIKAHIDLILDVEEASKGFEKMAWEQHELNKIQSAISVQHEIIRRNSVLRAGIYEDLQSGLLDKEEYLSIKTELNERITTADAAIIELQKRRTCIEEGVTTSQEWLEQFEEFKSGDMLTRKLIVNLIQRIDIRSTDDIKVSLMFAAKQVEEKYEYLLSLKEKQKIVILPAMEVV